MSLPVTFEDVLEAGRRIRPRARRTPLLPLSMEGEIYVKPENLQVTGSFKFRGAFNAISALDAGQRARGVVTHSSGNHAQAVAAAARLQGVKATVVIPESAPAFKVDRTRAWGAEVVRCGSSTFERERVAAEIAARTGAVPIPSADHAQVIAGQGTIGLEIVEDLPRVRTVAVCIGGGGLAAGTALAVTSLAPEAKVFGVEPELAADATESLARDKIVTWPAEKVNRTIADGVRLQSIGVLNFAILRERLAGMVTVPDEALIEAVRWYAVEAKLVVEPTGALTLAALRTGALRADGPTVLVISGGNVAPEALGKYLGG